MRTVTDMYEGSVSGKAGGVWETSGFVGFVEGKRGSLPWCR